MDFAELPNNKTAASSAKKYSSTTNEEGGSRGSGKNWECRAQGFEKGNVSYFEKFQSNSSHNKSATIDCAVRSSKKNEVTRVKQGQQNATLTGNKQKRKTKMRRFADDSKTKRGAPHQHKPQKGIRKKGAMVTARNERGTYGNTEILVFQASADQRRKLFGHIGTKNGHRRRGLN